MSWRIPVTRGALLLMESMWVYAFVAFLVAVTTAGGKPSIPCVLLIVYGSYGISRLLQNSDLALGPLRIWGTVLSLLLFYAIVRVDFFADWRFWDFSWADALFNNTEATLRAGAAAVIGVPLLWLVWLRGILRGQQHTGFEFVMGDFAIGVVIVAFVELFAGGVDAPRAVGLLAVPYVGVGLLAVGLAHAARSEEEFGRSFAPSWLAAVGGAVLVLGAIALLFVFVDVHTAFETLSGVALMMGYALAKRIYYLTWPIVKALEWILAIIGSLFRALYGGQPRDSINPSRTPDPNEQNEGPTRALPGWLHLAIRIFVAAPIVALLIVGTALLFTRLRRRLGPREIKESTYREGRLGADIGDFVGSLLGRLRPNLHFGGDHLDAVRRLYFDMLAAAAQRGVERRPAETPLELSPRLSSAFATETPSRVTSLFDDARYGGLAPPEDTLRRLRAEWEQTRRG